MSHSSDSQTSEVNGKRTGSQRDTFLVPQSQRNQKSLVSIQGTKTVQVNGIHCSLEVHTKFQCMSVEQLPVVTDVNGTK